MTVMKSILWLFAAMVMLAACNNESTSDTEETADNGELQSTDIKNPNTMNGNDAVEGYPELTFVKDHHDFGHIQQGQVVKYEFEFTNTGDADLIITNATSTCGCTVPEYPKEPIKPGESGVIPVEFDSRGKENKVSKTVTLVANTNPNMNYLTIETFIEK